MKKLLLPVLITSALAVTACCDKSKAKKAAAPATTEASAAGSKLAGLAALFAVPAVADIAGLDGGSEVGKGMFNYFDGEKVQSVDGEVYKFVHPAEGAEGEFSQEEFDASITEKMKELGAKEITNDVLPEEAAKELAEKEGTHDSTYLGKDVDFTKTKLRQFIVEDGDKKNIYQVFSDEKHGEVGVVSAGAAAEEPAAEEPASDEPKKVTSEDIKKELDELKKAIVNINFDSAKATIQEDNKYVIDELNKLMSDYPELNLTIQGHTDNTGNAEGNKTLSLERAKTVKSSVVAKGIDEARLKTEGAGAEKPIADNETEEGRLKNRRVELVEF